MKLSEAIRLGSMMRPQARNVLYNPARGTCAIGAALDACGVDLDAVEDEMILKLFPVAGLVVHPPGADGSWIPHQRVLSHIISLNDDCLWTREQIADWVETIEQKQSAEALQDIGAVAESR